MRHLSGFWSLLCQHLEVICHVLSHLAVCPPHIVQPWPLCLHKNNPRNPSRAAAAFLCLTVYNLLALRVIEMPAADVSITPSRSCASQPCERLQIAEQTAYACDMPIRKGWSRETEKVHLQYGADGGKAQLPAEAASLHEAAAGIIGGHCRCHQHQALYHLWMPSRADKRPLSSASSTFSEGGYRGSHMRI